MLKKSRELRASVPVIAYTQTQRTLVGNSRACWAQRGAGQEQSAPPAHGSPGWAQRQLSLGGPWHCTRKSPLTKCVTKPGVLSVAGRAKRSLVLQSPHPCKRRFPQRSVSALVTETGFACHSSTERSQSGTPGARPQLLAGEGRCGSAPRAAHLRSPARAPGRSAPLIAQAEVKRGCRCPPGSPAAVRAERPQARFGLARPGATRPGSPRARTLLGVGWRHRPALPTGHGRRRGQPNGGRAH